MSTADGKDKPLARLQEKLRELLKSLWFSARRSLHPWLPGFNTPMIFTLSATLPRKSPGML